MDILLCWFLAIVAFIVWRIHSIGKQTEARKSVSSEKPLPPNRNVSRLMPVVELNLSTPGFHRIRPPQPIGDHRKILPPAAVEPVLVVSGSRPQSEAESHPALLPSMPQQIPVRWLAHSESISIAGCTINGGHFYYGDLACSSAFAGEPAVIDPSLAVATNGGNGLWTSSYWPQYASCSPSERYALLRWLSTGRKDPGAPIGLVFLYFYGLERRLLNDAQTMASARADVPQLIAEIDRLRRIYLNTSFQLYAASLRDLSVALYGDIGRFRVTGENHPGSPSSGLIVALGRRIKACQPLTAELAFGWTMSLDGAPRTTAVRSILEELKKLFEQRYVKTFGSGLMMAVAKKTLVLNHRGAAVNRTCMSLHLDLPDVRSISGRARKLCALLDECIRDLEPLVRARQRHPQHALEIASAMPAEISERGVSDALASLAIWAEEILRGGTGIISVKALLAASGYSSVAKVRKRDLNTAILALERLGYGLEPDIRWNGPMLNTDGHAVLFHLDGATTKSPSSAYLTAQLFLNIAIAVAAADGTIDNLELDAAKVYLEKFSTLMPSDRQRLGAHLYWLTTTKPSQHKLLKILAFLPKTERRAMADAAILVAVADGRVDAGEMRMLERIYGALGLDLSQIAAEVHRAQTGEKQQAKMKSGELLDTRALAHKLEETAIVQRLLNEIFAEQSDLLECSDRNPSSATQQPLQNQNENVDGMDPRHAALLKRILDQANDAVKRSDVEAWCRELGLMTNGALEIINEAAFEVTGYALFDIDEDVTIHPDIREALRSHKNGVLA